MTTLGTPQNPLRVAVVGCGPSGFYVAQHLQTNKEVTARVDMFDRLPTPFGLVRYGVAPDHQKVKNVTKVYTKIATDPSVRYFGGVEFGKDLTIEDVRRHYHMVAFTTGAQTDRKLGIPGEDLAGSHPATEFVAWYNGHPDYRDYKFDLDTERAVVIGVGNVAIDVARILCRTPAELARTDIADYALEALKKSKVREVYLVGRRGPAQAAFTNSEIEEVGELEDADAITLPGEVEVDPLSLEELQANPDRLTEKKVEVLKSYAAPKAHPKSKKLFIRFLLSPTEIFGDANGHVSGIRLVRNELYKDARGGLKSRSTDETQDVETGIVFRSVGYRGVALPGVPFRDDWGTIPHEAGRVIDLPSKQPVEGEYVAGWIKRGPSGVIGTNRPCAGESVKTMVEDMKAGKHFHPTADLDQVPAVLRSRGVHWITFPDWMKLDEIEVAKGEAAGRPRVKFCDPDEIFGTVKA